MDFACCSGQSVVAHEERKGRINLFARPQQLQSASERRIRASVTRRQRLRLPLSNRAVPGDFARAIVIVPAISSCRLVATRRVLRCNNFNSVELNFNMLSFPPHRPFIARWPRPIFHFTKYDIRPRPLAAASCGETYCRQQIMHLAGSPMASHRDSYAIQNAWIEIKGPSPASSKSQYRPQHSKAMHSALGIDEPDSGFFSTTCLADGGLGHPTASWYAGRKPNCMRDEGGGACRPNCTIFDFLNAKPISWCPRWKSWTPGRAGRSVTKSTRKIFRYHCRHAANLHCPAAGAAPRGGRSVAG